MSEWPWVTSFDNWPPSEFTILLILTSLVGGIIFGSIMAHQGASVQRTIIFMTIILLLGAMPSAIISSHLQDDAATIIITFSHWVVFNTSTTITQWVGLKALSQYRSSHVRRSSRS